jgi:hypothetical protein
LTGRNSFKGKDEIYKERGLIYQMTKKLSQEEKMGLQNA